MTTFYNYTKSAITGQYFLQTWFRHADGTFIDEGKSTFKTKAAMLKELDSFTDVKPMSAEMLRAVGLFPSQYA